MPQDANNLGHVFGGVILSMMDKCSAIAAYRHSRAAVVTASIDRVDFREPIHIDDLVIMKASVNYVGRSSMEVGVRVEAEELITGRRRHTNSCYLTFVAVDRRASDRVPPRVPETTGRKCGAMRLTKSAAAAGSRNAQRKRGASHAEILHAGDGEQHAATGSPHCRRHCRPICSLAVQGPRVRAGLVSNTVALPHPRAAELEREVAVLAAEMEHFQRELAALGVEFKDYVQGLVDFPAQHEGRTVFLCWALANPRCTTGTR